MSHGVQIHFGLDL